MNPNDLSYGENLIIEKLYDDQKIKKYTYKTKPQKRTIIIDNEAYIESLMEEDNYDEEEIEEIIDIEQRRINVPELVFLITIYEHKYGMSELGSFKVFISENNQLYKSSFLNLYDGGVICLGDNILKSPTLTPKDVVSHFWNSSFNFSLCDHKKWEKGSKINLTDFLSSL